MNVTLTIYQLISLVLLLINATDSHKRIIYNYNAIIAITAEVDGLKERRRSGL